MEIKILPLPKDKQKAKVSDESKLGFGQVFTDRMFFAEWRADRGWFNAQIKPYEPFVLDPSCLVFHYSQEIFEGLKAYRSQAGEILLFRPEMNGRRFNLSADRLCMPEVPEPFFLQAVQELVYLEREWVPSMAGTSLYIRPTMIAVDPFLGVRAANHYYFYIILSPVGPYYTSGFNPIAVMVEDQYIRAMVGGTGEAKTGGNYASSLKAGVEAKKKGFDQVLWLDGVHRRYIEEAGATNIFFVYEDRIVTPPLEGSILHGITRDSILKLIPSLGWRAEERKIDIHELMREVRSQKIKEVFCSGTAAAITPVGSLSYKGETLEINQKRVGPIVAQLYETLTNIQYGKIGDPFQWVRRVSPVSIKERLHHVLTQQQPSKKH